MTKGGARTPLSVILREVAGSRTYPPALHSEFCDCAQNDGKNNSDLP